MKTEEAIEILELPKDPLKSGTHYHAIPSSKRISYADYLSARKAAIEALEKQVPKKPERLNAFKSIGKCKGCEKVISTRTASVYCQYCGNKVDWRNEE